MSKKYWIRTLVCVVLAVAAMAYGLPLIAIACGVIAVVNYFLAARAEQDRERF